MERVCLVCICIAAGCYGGESKSTRSSAIAAGSTQVCTVDGEGCFADCPATVDYNGSTCTFSASEQALRQGLSCSEGPVGRCYYTCPSTDGSTGGSGYGGSSYGSGDTFVYSTASPVCTVPPSCTEPDGRCDPSCPADPDCAPPACDDHDACTVNYLDDNGQCQQDALPCDDNDACTTDSCDPVLGCVHTPVTCDDGDACTTDSCDPRLGCVAPPTECDDHNQCTSDGCNTDGSCSFTPLPDGTPCNDGDDNTFDDACAGGTCVGTTHCATCCS